MDWMSNNKADYTNTFCYLMGVAMDDRIYEDVSFKKWLNEWKVRSRLNNSNNEKQSKFYNIFSCWNILLCRIDCKILD